MNNEIKQQRINYVAEFSDGTVKTGVTNDLARRIVELSRSKRDDAATLIRAVSTPAVNSLVAFRIEAMTCRLLSYLSPGASREWFMPRPCDRDLYNFVRQTVGMHWNMATHGRVVSYSEVSV